MKNILTSRSFYFSFCLFVFFFFLMLPFVAFGEQAKFVPLAGLPGIDPNAPKGLADYLNKLYLFLIVVGALLETVKIAIAGAKYALSDVITNKESAKSDIKGVLIGLAILLIPYLVLSTIYSPLTNLNILKTPSSGVTPP